MRLLRISRTTLHRWKDSKKLRTVLLPNSQLNYNDEDVYSILNQGVKRKTVIYARVSTPKQKKDLQNQVEQLKQWCFMNGKQISIVYEDIASGISFEKRKEFFKMLDEIMERRVEEVILTYKDRLSRVGFGLFQHLFEKFGTKLTVISEVGNPKVDSEEVFEEIVSLLHCYSMKLYSRRKNKTIEVGIDESSTS